MARSSGGRSGRAVRGRHEIVSVEPRRTGIRAYGSGPMLADLASVAVLAHGYSLRRYCVHIDTCVDVYDSGDSPKCARTASAIKAPRPLPVAMAKRSRYSAVSGGIGVLVQGGSMGSRPSSWAGIISTPRFAIRWRPARGRCRADRPGAASRPVCPRSSPGLLRSSARACFFVRARAARR